MGVLFFIIIKVNMFRADLIEQICLISEYKENKTVAQMCRFTVYLGTLYAFPAIFAWTYCKEQWSVISHIALTM